MGTHGKVAHTPQNCNHLSCWSVSHIHRCACRSVGIPSLKPWILAFILLNRLCKYSMTGKPPQSIFFKYRRQNQSPKSVARLLKRRPDFLNAKPQLAPISWILGRLEINLFMSWITNWKAQVQVSLSNTPVSSCLYFKIWCACCAECFWEIHPTCSFTLGLAAPRFCPGLSQGVIVSPPLPKITWTSPRLTKAIVNFCITFSSGRSKTLVKTAGLPGPASPLHLGQDDWIQ